MYYDQYKIKIGPLLKSGDNHGTGVLISLVGLSIMIATLIAWGVPQLRHVEVDLPDHDSSVGIMPDAQPA